MRLKALGAALCALFLLAGPALAQLAPFHWLDGSTVAITNNNSSTNAALLKMPTGVAQLRLVSGCTTLMYIKKGSDSSVTATSSDLPIAPGEVEVLTVNNLPSSPVSYLAMISPGGSCTLYVTTGSGI